MAQMMHTVLAVCQRCNQTFTFPEHNRGKTHLLFCVRCGRHKRIRPSDLKEYYRNNINTLLSPPTTARRSPAEPVTPILSDTNLDIRKYVYMVEHLAGSCICGSVFRFAGKPRCPRCRSAVIRTKTVNVPPDAAEGLPEKNRHEVAA